MGSFIVLHYCYNYLINQISIGLLLYSHIPVAITGLLMGGFLLFRARKLPNILLFLVSLFFATWCFLDLGSWFAFLGSGVMMTTWSLADLFAPLFFFFSYYFLYVFLNEKDLPVWQKVVGAVLMTPIAIWVFLGEKLTLYDANSCEAYENVLHNNYQFLIEGIFLLSTIVLAIYLYLKAKDLAKKKQIILASTGVVIFLGFFLLSTLGVNFLVSDNAVQFAYNLEIYGLFGMPFLLGFLIYLVVRYKAFNIKTFGAQALIVVLIILIGSQFSFVQDLSSTILTAVTLVITGVIGINLMRSVKKEIEQKEQLAKLNIDLEQLISQRESLVHLVTHKVKGSFTRSKYIFAGILDGTFGAVTPEIKKIAEQGLESDNMGIETVDLVLSVANMQKGIVKYDMKEVDFRDIIEKTLADKKMAIEKKGLEIETNIKDSSYKVNGDAFWLREVVNNFIENSTKYTQHGKIIVGLEKKANKVLFSVKDTGIGITSLDKVNLFTEGGRGKDSVKVNVDSTGYGLYSVKLIVEAHKGKVWAESEGAEKGSIFYIELDAA